MRHQAQCRRASPGTISGRDTHKPCAIRPTWGGWGGWGAIFKAPYLRNGVRQQKTKRNCHFVHTCVRVSHVCVCSLSFRLDNIKCHAHVLFCADTLVGVEISRMKNRPRGVGAGGVRNAPQNTVPAIYFLRQPNQVPKAPTLHYANTNDPTLLLGTTP